MRYLILIITILYSYGLYCQQLQITGSKTLCNGNDGNYTLSNFSNGSHHSFTWSSTTFSSSQLISNGASLTLISNNECKKGVIKCFHQFMSGSSLLAETAEIEVTTVPFSGNPILNSSKNEVLCGSENEIQFSISGLCASEYIISIIWNLPIGWKFKSTPGIKDNTITVITDKYTQGQVSVQITGSCTNVTILSPNIYRGVSPISNVNGTITNNDIVASNYVSIKNATSNPNISTDVKAQNYILVEPVTELKNNAGFYTELKIKPVTDCSAKMASEDSTEADSSSKSVLLNSNEFDIELYPNPTAEILNLNFKNLTKDNIEFNIYDLVGKLVYNQTIKDNNGPSLETKISLENLSNGNYIVNFKNGKQTKQKRLTINK